MIFTNSKILLILINILLPPLPPIAPIAPIAPPVARFTLTWAAVVALSHLEKGSETMGCVRYPASESKKVRGGVGYKFKGLKIQLN
jgi:hypothetical protein